MAHSDSRPEELLHHKKKTTAPKLVCPEQTRQTLQEASSTRPLATADHVSKSTISAPYQQDKMKQTANVTRSPRASPRKPRKAAATSAKVVEMGVKSTPEVDVDTSSVTQTVEILKRPGQSLGFYIREGNGYDQAEGVFISRIAPGSVVESNGLLRVGDEILTINSVDVSRMSLDDVVILMSIPKRLVLNIRTRKNTGNKNSSCPSLHSLQPAEEPPVVVLKSRGRANSSSAVEMTEKCPDEFSGLAGSNFDYKYYSDHSPYATYKGYPKPGTYDTRQYTPDDSGDSGLSSENSGCSGKDQGQKLISPGHTPQGHTPQDRLANILDVKQYEIDGRNYHTRMSPRESSPGVSFRSPVVSRRNPYVQMEYPNMAEAPDPRYTHARSSSDVLTYKTATSPRAMYDQAAVRAFQDEIERTHHRYEPPNPSQQQHPHQQHKPSRLFAKIRHLSPDRYNSDTEVITSRTKDLLTLERQQAQLSRLLSTDDRCNSLPQMDPSKASSDEIQQWLARFTVGTEQRAPVQQQVPLGYATTTAAMMGGASRGARETFSSEEYQNWISTQMGFLTQQQQQQPAQYLQSRPDMTFPRQHGSARVNQYHQLPVNHGRVTRKMSADSLMEYRTYQLDDDMSAGSHPGTLLGTHRSHKVSTGNLSDVGTSVTASPLPKSARSAQRYSVDAEGRNVPSPSTRLKDLQLSRKPLQIRTEDFKPYQPDTEDRKAKYEKSLDGLLTIHVLCGHGLKSSRTMLRDLYCVIEVDNVNKARTMIRTGAINFDWDEAFDVDLENARELSFQIYSWDPNTRHRLCYSCTVGLHNLIQAKTEKIALKLEPKGILYIALDFQEPSRCFQRKLSVRRNALFGAELDTVVLSEGSTGRIPIIIKKCVEEVERRGLDHVGIYRLCGSAKRKTQLKEEFEKNAKAVDIGHQSVSDINVITGVLKDYLRELPEPLFTNSLYQMLVDALSVRLAADPDGSAKLMLSILECLPKVNQDSLAYIMDHLKRVSVRCDVNKMNTANLAICFGPLLLCPSPASCGASGHALNFKKHIEVLKYLLDIWPEYREGGLPLSSETLVSSVHSSTSTIKTDSASGSTVVVKQRAAMKDHEVSSL